MTPTDSALARLDRSRLDPGDVPADDALNDFRVALEGAVKRQAVQTAKCCPRGFCVPDVEVECERFVGERVRVSVTANVKIMLDPADIADIDGGIASVSCYLAHLWSGVR